MSPPLVKLSAEPTLQDLLELVKKDILLTINCHALATIQEFDSDEQTVRATVNYKRTVYIRDALGTYTPQLVPYPVLVDCPIIVMGGGGNGSLTFPIAAGDQCLMMFNDRDMDNWLDSRQAGQEVATGRLHSFSDGIALVGLNLVTDYDTTRVLLKKGNTKLGLGAKVLITNGTSLNTVLQNLVTHLQTLTTALAALTVTGVTAGGGVSGVPANAAAITAVGVQLAADATAIGGLLE